PPHPEVERQLRLHRPSVAEKHRMLPLASGEELVLVALAGRANETEKKRRVLVVEVAGLRAGSERSRGVGREVESSAGVRSVGLPVVEMEVIHTIASPEIVPPLDLRNVGAERHRSLVAIRGGPGR